MIGMPVMNGIGQNYPGFKFPYLASYGENILFINFKKTMELREIRVQNGL